MATPRTIRSGLFGALLLTWAALPGPLSLAADPASLLDLKLPAVFFKPAPEGVDDLKAIQSHVNRVIKEVMPAVVNVRIGPAQGSGVVISEDGLILTAGHVAGKPGQNVIVTFPDGKEVKGKTLGSNIGVDNGMMRITTPGKYPFVQMGQSSHIKAGDWCLTIGHPGGLKKGRTPPVRLGRITTNLDDIIQTDCPLVGGDSGGPLFDMRGLVVGIHSRIGPKITDNIHVPVDTYRGNWEWLLKEERWSGGRFGITPGDDARGCRIAAVTAGSAAEKAGILKNDVVTAINGKIILGKEQLLAVTKLRHAGDVVTVDVRRGEEVLRLRVTLDEGIIE
jgi:serine protease Do